MYVTVPGRVFVHLSPNLSWMLTDTWGPGSILREVGGGDGVVGRFIFLGWGGGEHKRKKSPDFRCPEVETSAMYMTFEHK